MKRKRRKPRPARRASYVPTTKTISATGAGSVSTLLIWGFGKCGIQISPDIASAMTTLVMAAAAYFTPHIERKKR